MEPAPRVGRRDLLKGLLENPTFRIDSDKCRAYRMFKPIRDGDTGAEIKTQAPGALAWQVLSEGDVVGAGNVPHKCT